MPKRHLIGQEVQGPAGGPIDLAGNPGISMVITQYLYDTGDQEMGGLKGLDYEYQHNKPIEENETDYFPLGYRGDRIADSRVEAWEFMVGGGASFNQLNGLYTVKNPAGRTPENAQLLRALHSLREFIYSFDFLKMHPGINFVRGGIPTGTYCRGLSEAGRQYALYHHHSTGGRGSVYTITPGNYTEVLVLDLPAGKYRFDWVDPATGTLLQTDVVNHHGGSLSRTTPKHTVDVALRIKRS